MKAKLAISLALILVLATSAFSAPVATSFSAKTPTCAQVQAYVDFATSWILSSPQIPDAFKAQLIQGVKDAAARIPCRP